MEDNKQQNLATERAMSAATSIIVGSILEEAYNKLERYRAGIVGATGTRWSADVIHLAQDHIHDVMDMVRHNIDVHRERLAELDDNSDTEPHE